MLGKGNLKLDIEDKELEKKLLIKNIKIRRIQRRVIS